MAAKERSWEPNWIRGRKIGGGGQAATSLPQRTNDEPDRWSYVMKVLRQKDKPERRARMFVEAGALERLNHKGVAKLVAAVTDLPQDDMDVFLITELIEGVDLEKFRTGYEINLPDASIVIIKLLETLRDCHKLGVIHRDIKPCHVILREGKLADPVLIDFGLAFGDDLGPSEFSTASAQGLGNRFIILPEQWSESAAKRLPASDLAQVVGLLFFLLIKQNPGILVDERNRKPHQRFQFREAISALAKWQINQLQRIFDIGFEYD